MQICCVSVLASCDPCLHPTQHAAQLAWPNRQCEQKTLSCATAAAPMHQVYRHVTTSTCITSTVPVVTEEIIPPICDPFGHSSPPRIHHPSPRIHHPSPTTPAPSPHTHQPTPSHTAPRPACTAPLPERTENARDLGQPCYCHQLPPFI